MWLKLENKICYFYSTLIVYNIHLDLLLFFINSVPYSDSNGKPVMSFKEVNAILKFVFYEGLWLLNGSGIRRLVRKLLYAGRRWLSRPEQCQWNGQKWAWMRVSWLWDSRKQIWRNYKQDCPGCWLGNGNKTGSMVIRLFNESENTERGWEKKVSKDAFSFF